MAPTLLSTRTMQFNFLAFLATRQSIIINSIKPSPEVRKTRENEII